MRFELTKMVKVAMSESYFFNVHLKYEDGTEGYFGWNPDLETLTRKQLVRKGRKMYNELREIAEQRKKALRVRTERIELVKQLIGQKLE